MTVAEKNRDFQELKKDLERQNWRVDRTNRGHYQFFAPDGKGKVTGGGSYGDHRAIKNLVSQLRKAGFNPSKGKGHRVK